MAGKTEKDARWSWGRILASGTIVLIWAAFAAAATPDELETIRQEVRELRKIVSELTQELSRLKQEGAEEGQYQAQDQQSPKQSREDVDKIEKSELPEPALGLDRFHWGGYGELHANFGTGGDPDLIDFHRLVLYLGYDFSDWIKFHSETELEHAFVSDGSGGELLVEQLYVDFLLTEPFNIRVGKVITPLGIINRTHEPPTFNGVERPSFAKYIIPTTWSSDGVGFFGGLGPSFTYEAYLVGGLDGSKFTAKDGIRKGRIKERPSLNEPALTGRIDFYPFAESNPDTSPNLRLGLSGYFGGLDNANKGMDPGIDGDIHIYSADFQCSLSKFDFRGAVAHIDIEGARKIGAGTAEELFGWYLEAGYHFWPQMWKRGKLAKSDAVVFVRYDVFDTQYKMPSGIARDPTGDRNEWTIGTNFYLTPNFVIKADYQIPDDATGDSLNDRFNLGIGWQF